MTIKTKLTPHYDISTNNLKEIINIKSIHWSYSEEQHKRWINENLLQDDLHLLIYEDDKLIAYTNFISTEAIVNNKIYSFMGVGNVCTRTSGKGHGSVLMQTIGDILLNNSWNGTLFCKNHLINYYKKFGWKLINQEKIIDNRKNDINVMTYNFNEVINSIHYNIRDF